MLAGLHAMSWSLPRRWLVDSSGLPCRHRKVSGIVSLGESQVPCYAFLSCGTNLSITSLMTLAGLCLERTRYVSRSAERLTIYVDDTSMQGEPCRPLGITRESQKLVLTTLPPPEMSPVTAGLHVSFHLGAFLLIGRDWSRPIARLRLAHQCKTTHCSMLTPPFDPRSVVDHPQRNSFDSSTDIGLSWWSLRRKHPPVTLILE